MARTLGYHLVKSGYGLWLPGDLRGSWSEAWDEEMGYVEPHMLHAGDPVRRRMAEERMKFAPVRFSPVMMEAIAGAIGECAVKSDWKIAAAAIEATHVHLLITYSGHDIDVTAKWLADQTTKAVHRGTGHEGPVWCKGNWCGYLFDEGAWSAAGRYIERHNERRGAAARPHDFITAGLF